MMYKLHFVACVPSTRRTHQKRKPSKNAHKIRREANNISWLKIEKDGRAHDTTETKKKFRYKLRLSISWKGVISYLRCCMKFIILGREKTAQNENVRSLQRERKWKRSSDHIVINCMHNPFTLQLRRQQPVSKAGREHFEFWITLAMLLSPSQNSLKYEANVTKSRAHLKVSSLWFNSHIGANHNLISSTKQSTLNELARSLQTHLMRIGIIFVANKWKLYNPVQYKSIQWILPRYSCQH